MISPAGVLGTASALVLATVACGGDPDVEVRRNGEPFPGTADFNTRRVNVLVEDDTVVAIDGVG